MDAQQKCRDSASEVLSSFSAELTGLSLCCALHSAHITAHQAPAQTEGLSLAVSPIVDAAQSLILNFESS